MNDFTAVSKVCTLDEHGRLLLPAFLRNQLNLEPEDRLTVFANLRHKFMELLKQEFGELCVDAYGRVCISEEYRNAMGWGAKDKILVQLNKEAGSISLTLSFKHVPKFRIA